MIYTITAPHIHSCEIKLPASKSLSNRQLLINVLSVNQNQPRNLSDSDDTTVMLKALQSDCSHVDVGAAGTSMRFLTAYLSLLDGQHFITGSERMKNRPIAVLVDALRMLGADIEYAEKEGYPPLRINGHELRGGTLTLPGSVSSQYISAIMMIAPLIKGGLHIELTGKIVSKPYIYMTLKTMEQFGVCAIWNNNIIDIPEGQYKHIASEIESDWSAASYWYQIAALAPSISITLNGLLQNSLQGDAEGRFIAEKLGVSTLFDNNNAIISADKNNLINDIFEYDFNSQPDLAQTYVVLCCCLNIKFKFTGLESLKIKETDRIAALINECRKIGFVLHTNNIDTLSWNGEKCATSDEAIQTYKDHRMAMAFAPVAICLGKIRIADPSVVSKSYPAFWTDLQKAGVEIEEEK